MLTTPHRKIDYVTTHSKSYGYWIGDRGSTVVKATNRKVAESILDCVIGIFHSHNPTDRTMAPGVDSEMNTRSISWG